MAAETKKDIEQPSATPPVEELSVAVIGAEQETFWGNHRLSLLLILTVIIAVFLTVFSMVIYSQSGAAQLDLSRPGYKSVSNQVQIDDTTSVFQASGPVDKSVIEEFTKMYDEQSRKANSVDAFNGDPLNPEVLF